MQVKLRKIINNFVENDEKDISLREDSKEWAESKEKRGKRRCFGLVY